MEKSGKRKTETGAVISAKMQKTIIVGVTRTTKHKKYEKIIRHLVKYKVHDEKNSAKAGDRVEIEETRPLSKDKRWRLVKILNNSNNKE